MQMGHFSHSGTLVLYTLSSNPSCSSGSLTYRSVGDLDKASMEQKWFSTFPLHLFIFGLIHNKTFWDAWNRQISRPRESTLFSLYFRLLVALFTLPNTLAHLMSDYCHHMHLLFTLCFSIHMFCSLVLQFALKPLAFHHPRLLPAYFLASLRWLLNEQSTQWIYSISNSIKQT